MPDIFITTQGIENLINDFKIHKASGPDALSPWILEETSNIIALILQIIFQATLHSGRVPINWTTAFVTPIKKSNNIVLYLSIIYQYVSLTCITSKILERIVVCSTTKHLAIKIHGSELHSQAK